MTLLDRPKRESYEAASNARQTSDTFTFFSAAEFDALDLRRPYHIPGVLAAGPVPTVLAGSYKTLKTSIAMDIAVSVATGAAFLGVFPVSKACNVAMMSGESGGNALQSLARRVTHAKGWTMDAVGERLRICTAVPNTARRSDLIEIERFVLQKKIGLLFLDPAYLMMRGMRSDEAGNLFAMAQFLNPLGKLAELTGCTVCIVHHNSRGATRANAGEPAELSDIAWAGFAEWAGQWLLLSRRERFNPDSNGEHHLWLSAGGRDGHANVVGVNVTEGRSDDAIGLRWEVSVERASHVRRETVTATQEKREAERQIRMTKQLESDANAVLGTIQSLNLPETKTGIRNRCGIRSERFNVAFAKLLTEKRIVSQTIEKGNKRPYEGYIAVPHRDAPGRNGTHPDL